MLSATHSRITSTWVSSPRGLVCIGPAECSPRLREVLPAVATISIEEKLANAVDASDYDGVVQLLNSGASALRPPAEGLHRDVVPFALAARGARPEPVLRLLLEQGSAEDAELARLNTAAAVQAWTTGYVDVAEYGGEARAKLYALIEYGADVDQRIQHSGDAPLHTVARIFAAQRAKKSEPGQTGHWARLRSETAHFKFSLLLEARADPELRNLRHQTPFDLIGPDRWELLQPM